MTPCLDGSVRRKKGPKAWWRRRSSFAVGIVAGESMSRDAVASGEASREASGLYGT